MNAVSGFWRVQGWMRSVPIWMVLSIVTVLKASHAKKTSVCRNSFPEVSVLTTHAHNTLMHACTNTLRPHLFLPLPLAIFILFIYFGDFKTYILNQREAAPNTQNPPVVDHCKFVVDHC